MTIAWSTIDGVRRGSITSLQSQALLATGDWWTPAFLHWSFTELARTVDAHEFEQLVERLDAWYRTLPNAPLMQVLIDDDDERALQGLQRSGWQIVTRVVQWGAIPTVLSQIPRVQLVSHTTMSPDAFTCLLTATQQEICETPLWLDLSDSVDWGEVFRASSHGCVDDWYVVTVARDVIGCALLYDLCDRFTGIQWHYLGLLPAWRRRGLGVDVVWAVRDLANRRGRSLIVAADEYNRSAQLVYARGGLSPLGARVLLAKTHIA